MWVICGRTMLIALIHAHAPASMRLGIQKLSKSADRNEIDRNDK